MGIIFNARLNVGGLRVHARNAPQQQQQQQPHNPCDTSGLSTSVKINAFI